MTTETVTKNITYSDTLYIQNQISALKHITTSEALQVWLTELRDEYHLHNLSLLVLQPTSIQRANAALFTSQPHNTSDRLLPDINQSLIFRKVHAQQAPVYWTKSDLLCTQFKPHELHASSKPHTKHRGVSIPIYCQSFIWAIFSVQLDIHTPSAHLLELTPQFLLTTNNMLKCARRILCKSSNWYQKKQKISKRERECLHWVSEGKTSWEIALILGIKERTVNYHFTQLVGKLCARNRNHAMAKVLLNSLITPTCSEINEITSLP